MGAVWMRMSAELRGRRRAIVAMAVLLGLAGAAVLASFAGARRTASAYPRFIEAQDQFDALVDPASHRLKVDEEVFERVRGLEIVEDSSVVHLAGEEGFGTSVIVRGRAFGFPDVFVISVEGGGFLNTFHVMKLLEGERADPDDPSEVEMPFTVADRFGLAVGDQIGIGFGPTEKYPEGVERTVRVAGIGATPGSFEPTSGSYFPFVVVSRRLIEEVGAASDPVQMVDLAGDAAGLDALRGALRAFPEDIDAASTLDAQTEAVERSSRFQVAALQILGVLALLAAVAVLGQALSRATLLGGEDAETLAALGMSRGQVLGLGVVRALVTGSIAAVVAVGGAILLSPATPIGPMRIAEPDLGVAADWLVLGPGALALIGIVVAIAAIPSWRVSSAVRRARARSETTVTDVRTSGLLARAGAPPTAIAGVRAAFERGHGTATVPVRTTLAGAALSIAALVAALVFAASLTHLLTTPRLAGYDFDALVAAEPPVTGLAERARRIDVVEAVGIGGGPGISIGGVELLGFVYASGDVHPSMAAGEAPDAVDEIAIGPRTMRRLRVRIGDTIDVSIGNAETGELGVADLPVRVVGKAITPTFFFFNTPAGEGAVVSVELARRYIPDYSPDTMYVRFRDGVSVDDGIQALNDELGSTFLIPRRQSSDLANLARVVNLPYVLAALLALMGLGALAHTLLTSVRSRRTELGVLKSIGFVRSQVAGTVVWQTSALLLVALALGIPVGIAAGRWAWLTFADQIGVVPEAVVPSLAVAATVPIALVVANVIAAIPARSAARTRAAAILRTE